MFLDTASVQEIKQILPWGVISGVTTNQKIFLAEKDCVFEDRVKEIASLIDGPLSIEVTASRVDEIIKEAKEYASWSPNIVIKVPMFGDGSGLSIVKALHDQGIKTNMTVLMNLSQVLLAVKAHATFASIFYNRVKDAGEDPLKLIADSVRLIERSGGNTRIIAGSIRKPSDVAEAFAAGVHIVTIPFKIMTQMPFHAKTEETLKEFDAAWRQFSSTRKRT